MKHKEKTVKGWMKRELRHRETGKDNSEKKPMLNTQ
jgi:hypothetical protein